MPLISSLSAGVRAFGLYVLSALVTVIDTFNRSDNASDLGSAGGQKWKIWRGVWGISTNKASSSTAASSYPLATLTFTRQDVTVGIGGPAPGTGASFWVTDANNWYSTVYVQTETCQTCTNCNAWNASNCNAFGCNSWTCNSAFCNGTWNASNCNSPGPCAIYNPATPPCYCLTTICNQPVNRTCANFSGGTCQAYNPSNCNRWNNVAPKGYCQSGAWNTSNCARWNAINCASWNNNFCNQWACLEWVCTIGNCIRWNCSGTFNVSNCNSWFCTSANCPQASTFCSGFFNPSNCNSFFSFSCNCQTEYRINIISSIASSVTTVVSTLWSGVIGSFKSVLSGNNITIKAYTNTNYTSQIGSDSVQTLLSPQKSKLFGIIKAPSTIGQGNSIDEFRVE